MTKVIWTMDLELAGVGTVTLVVPPGVIVPVASAPTVVPVLSANVSL